MQNNLGELLALLSFLMPEIFRSDVIETLLEFLGEGERKSDSSSPSVQVQSSVMVFVGPISVLDCYRSDIYCSFVHPNCGLVELWLNFAYSTPVFP